MTRRLLLLALLLTGCMHMAWAQNFLPRTVKVVAGQANDNDPRYGFITGVSADGTELFAVLISKNPRYFEQHPRIDVLLTEGKSRNKLVRKASADWVPLSRPTAVEGTYFLGVYRIAASLPTKAGNQVLSYARLGSLMSKNYRLCWDLLVDSDGFAPDFLMNNSEALNLLPMTRGTNLGERTIMFGFINEQHGGQAQAGMPVVAADDSDKSQPSYYLLGLVAETMPPATPTVRVLPVQALRRALAGGKEPSAAGTCTYFNLLEKGRLQTPCDSLRDEVRRSTMAAEQAAADRARMTRDERRMVNHDRDYPIALSLCVGGGLAGMYTKYTAGGADGTKYSASGDFSLGMTLHTGPDLTGSGHLSLRPRYAQFLFSPPDDYTSDSKVGFSLKQIRVQTVEMPIVLEFPVSHDIRSETYFGLGYVPGYQYAVDFSFDTPERGRQREPIAGNQHFTHKLLADYGFSKSKWRISINYTYEFRTFLHTDYGLIVGGEQQQPLRGMGGSYHHVGLELSYRLWGRWQNGLIRPGT